MTTIAFKDGIMAADRQMTNTQTNLKYEVSKLDRIGHSIIGCAGLRALTQQFLLWYAGGRRRDLLPAPWYGNYSFRALEWNGSSLILWQTMTRSKWHGFTDRLEDFIPTELKDDFASIGSGGHFALGAMSMGATAEQAVQIAHQFDSMTGDKVQVLSLT